MRTVVLVLALAAGSPALAQPPDKAPPPAALQKMQDQMPAADRGNLAMPPAPRGRYSFAPVDEGFLRLDHKSGEVALCRSQGGSWSCAAVPDGTAPPQKELDDLREQVDALKKEIASLREPPPPSPPPRPPGELTPKTDGNGGMKMQLPSKQDLARARVFIEDTWRRLVEMIENLQKDMIRKKADSDVSRT
jgi:hypothetical protein